MGQLGGKGGFKYSTEIVISWVKLGAKGIKVQYGNCDFMGQAGG